MKKILCFFMVALLAALLVVPCFAADTTVSPSDPVAWFGSGDLHYTYTGLGFLGSSAPASDVTAYSDFILSGVSISAGDTWRINKVDAVTFNLVVNNVNKGQVSNGSLPDFSLVESSYTSLSGTTIFGTERGSSQGFLDSGVSDALTELSLIVSAILSYQYILIAIGLAVAVPLVAWGIFKIKSLVKGY